MRKNYLSWGALTLAAGAFAQCTPALAADAAADTSAPQIADIVVTAQKRAENIQSVPIAVTAISGQKLEDQRVLSTQSLQASVPSLVYTSGAGFATPFLRGIGASGQGPGTEPSVATFIDGVYVANDSGTIVSLLGVDRVEVLAGPQGTLYGRNASGGAISIYTLTPTDELQAKVSGTVGTHSRTEVSGYVSGPVTDRLDVGVYLGFTRHKSYEHFEGNIPEQHEYDIGYGARLKAVWRPTDGIKLTGSIEHIYSRDVDMAFHNVQPNALGVTLGGNPSTRDYHVYSSTPQYVRPGSTAATLREEFDLGFADLIGITGYRHLKAPTYANIGGTTGGLVGAANLDRIFSRQFSQEFQLVSKPGSKIKWIMGAYYFREHGGYGGLAIHSDILFAGLPFNTSVTSGDERTRSYAGFAQATAPLIGNLSLTLGGRYTHDTKIRPAQYTSQYNCNDAYTVCNLVFPAALASPRLQKGANNFSPRATLEYKIDDILLYATYSQGFKSGQFNVSDATDQSSVNPEKLTDYEVGLKSDLFDRRLRLNLAGYYYKFKNLQVQVLDPSGGGVAAIYRNAAKATLYGIEASAQAAVTRQLTLTASASYEHTKYNQFDDAPFIILSPFGNTNQLGHSAAGNSLIQAPKFTGNIGGTYAIPLAGDGHLDLHTDYYRNSGFFWDPVHQSKQNAYGLLNASITYVGPGNHWSLQVWGTNITNTHHYNQYAITAPFGTYAADAETQMYGVTATWKL